MNMYYLIFSICIPIPGYNPGELKVTSDPMKILVNDGHYLREHLRQLLSSQISVVGDTSTALSTPDDGVGGLGVEIILFYFINGTL